MLFPIVVATATGPAVPAPTQRRHKIEYKLRILAEGDAATEPGAIGPCFGARGYTA